MTKNIFSFLLYTVVYSFYFNSTGKWRRGVCYTITLVEFCQKYNVNLKTKLYFLFSGEHIHICFSWIKSTKYSLIFTSPQSNSLLWLCSVLKWQFRLKIMYLDNLHHFCKFLKKPTAIKVWKLLSGQIRNHIIVAFNLLSFTIKLS